MPVEEGGGGGEPQHLGPGGLGDLVPVRVDKPGPELGRGEMLAQVKVPQSNIFIVKQRPGDVILDYINAANSVKSIIARKYLYHNSTLKILPGAIRAS